MQDHVLIVDDEPIIRNGLKSFIDWGKLGLVLEGDCANGKEALAAFGKARIDILITDIKMPVMDGLELTRQALAINPNVKIILISSYNEFEYVREGMKQGAIDYLLKPTLEADELIAVLLRCKELLARGRKQAAFQQQIMLQTALLDRKRLEQDVIRSLVSGDPGVRFSDLFGMDMDAGPYVCAYVTADGLTEWQETYGNLHIGMMYEDMQTLFYDWSKRGCAPILSGEGLLLIYPDAHKHDRDAEAGHSLAGFQELVAGELSVSVTFGYCLTMGTEWLESGMSRSRSAAERRFYEGTGRIYAWNEAEAKAHADRHPEIEEQSRHALQELLRSDHSPAAIIDSFIMRWRTERPSPELVRRQSYELLTAFSYRNGDAKTLFDFRELVRRCDTISQLEAAIRSLAEEMEQPNRLRLADKGHSAQLIAKAIEYIKLHYREELTLQDVADSIHVSKSYLSNLFKKQSGHNFIDYVIDLRLHEAKRLLTQDEIKIYEVAERSGFNDVKYFSKLFKKMTQMTPVEYRDKHQ
ncbi:response regulator [Paenibacillus harenae]|uniref:response regulator n=1 Tax=Paenibacillus harenae TaxID=306543 RepID=UPI002790533F|nr:response regulator [Paenibacillus harenae]MDQ0061069.1 two-component system response regulator YesN [Paenibacillus harenae]